MERFVDREEVSLSRLHVPCMQRCSQQLCKMGGLISSGAVVFGKEPAKNEEVVSSMLRGSIISGMTLFCVNIIRSGSEALLHGRARLRLQRASPQML